MARNRNAGGISVKILADDKDFQQKLKNAAKVTSKRAKEMRDAFNTVGREMLKIGAIAGGAMAAGIALANSRLDKLAKTADKLGIAPAKLMALRHAAELTGVSAETLDMGLQRMVRRIAEASHGTGEAVNALKELGIRSQVLARMSPDEQFRALAVAMGDVALQGDWVRLGMKMFDSEAVGLVNTLKLGVEGLDAIEASMARYGIAVSRIDLAKVEQSSDAWAELKLIQQGFWDQMAIQVAPVLSEIAERTLDAADELGGMGSVAERVMGGMVTAGGYVGDVFWGWSLAIAEAQKGMVKLAKYMAENEVFNKGNPITEALYIAESSLLEADLFDAAEKEMVERGGIEKRSIFRAGRNRRDTDDPEIRSILEYAAKNRERLMESAGLKEPVVPEHLRGPRDTTSDDIAKEMESWIADIQSRIDSKVDAGSVSDRIKGAFDEISDRWSKSAEEAVKKNEATGKSVDALNTDIANLSTSTGNASKELDKLAASAIASNAYTGSNKQLAERAEALMRRAQAAEAQGRFEAADRYKERAEELDNRIRRRGDADDTEALKKAAMKDPEGKTAEGRAAIDELKRRKMLPGNQNDAWREIDKWNNASPSTGATVDMEKKTERPKDESNGNIVAQKIDILINEMQIIRTNLGIA